MNTDPDAFRTLIRDELAHIDESLHQAATAAATVHLDQSSVGRLSRMDALQQQAMARELRARLTMRKRRLEAALARVEAGSFGACCQCGDSLDARRLRHDPTVVFCQDCATEREQL